MEVHQQFKQISRIFFAINIWWPWRWANRHMTNRRMNCTKQTKCKETEFEKAGAVASADISLTAGQMPAELHLHGAMEPQLRKLCMPTRLESGGAGCATVGPEGLAHQQRVVQRVHQNAVHRRDGDESSTELLEEFTLCKTGDQLSADQARILKLFGHRLAHSASVCSLSGEKRRNLNRLTEGQNELNG
ncbi:hypothetical protein niasHT_018227 [Heterodera trifolii]|uniref:Uncharacterized protein n=1 Tax=Heterodera trifolii TaxID=157864 RepID=A0ABD2KVE8_9BILA